MTTLLAFLFVLGVLIFVHELGHFLAARRLGVRVLTFSLGFGPKLVKVVRGDTEYCISAVPLGGYVKMAGENPEDPRSGQPDEFLSKTKWERFQILIMGPVMNIVLAIVVMAIVLTQGMQVPPPPVVGSVKMGSPAERAGIMGGDRILTVGRQDIDTWNKLELEIVTQPNRDVPVTLQRDGRTVTMTVHTDAVGPYEAGDIGVLPNINPIVQALLPPGEVPGDPAVRAGLKAGDVVVAVNGTFVAFKSDLSDAISKNGERELELTIRRDGQEQRVRLTPVMNDGRPMIGVNLVDQFTVVMPTPVQAVKASFEKNWEASGLIFRTLGGLFTGATSVKQLQGPVGIAQLSGESAQAGWVSLLSLMAIISLNLGLLNLMPVPVLDGGHILIMGLEGIARRDFSMQVKEKMLLAGFVVLMMLMVTVIYNDLTRISWIERLMPWRN